MMCLASNQQKMFYSLQGGQTPIYETDSDGNVLYYTDDEGNQYPMETGETEIGYTEPVKFFGNIAMSGGEAEAREYGLDVSAYDATVVCDKNAVPLDESSLVWHKSEVEYKDVDKTIIEPNSADYRVVKVSESINFTKYILKAIVK